MAVQFSKGLDAKGYWRKLGEKVTIECREDKARFFFACVTPCLIWFVLRCQPDLTPAGSVRIEIQA
jgi:hypothetical protein